MWTPVTHQCKWKTVFQFFILFLKVVVLIGVAVGELVDLDFGLRQLLHIKTISLSPLNTNTNTNTKRYINVRPQ